MDTTRRRLKSAATSSPCIEVQGLPSPKTSVKRILPRAPILSSEKAEWNGILLEHHYQSAQETPEEDLPQHVICIFLGHPVRVEREINGQLVSDRLIYGDISVIPPHQPYRAIWKDGGEFLLMYLEPQIFARAAYESITSEGIEIVRRFSIRDPLIQQIGLALKKELETNGLGSRLYAESMANALAVHLLQHYSIRTQAIRDYTGRLSRYKVQQAIAIINDDLDRDLSLDAIAAVVEMSPYYFSRLFKQSTGLSPHQYVLHCRIEQAKQLLAKQELSILEICQQVGFQSQSHFSNVFRKHTGITPKAYREANKRIWF